jgi:signal transduction histidine kinase
MTGETRAAEVWPHPGQRTALLDFWRVYDQDFDAIIAEVNGILADHPENGPILRSLSPDALAKVNEQARAHLRRAIEDGDWSSYERDLRDRAELYARRGLTFAGWHETASVVMRCVTPLLLRAYRHDQERAEAAVLALQHLHDWRAVVLGGHFVREKQQMVAEAEAALRRSEEGLLRAENLAAVGELAGSVAHDFKNVLSIILSYTELLDRRVAHDPVALDEIEQVKQACSRATDLASQLLIVGRPERLEPAVLDLDEIVEEIARMLRPVLGVGIDVVPPPKQCLGRITIHRSRLEQIILNLVFNARDAMPRGGNLTLATTDVVRNGKSYVMLAVSDDGIGMDAATRARIFEPFFTTKEPGKGTGLGLATVRAIVEDVGGFVEARSEAGKGTTLEVYFPRSGPVFAGP